MKTVIHIVKRLTVFEILLLLYVAFKLISNN